MKNESLENRIDVVESPEAEDDKRNFYFFMTLISNFIIQIENLQNVALAKVLKFV